MRKTLLLYLAAAAACTAKHPCSAADPASRRPNIVILLAEDMGRRDATTEYYETPNINRLIERGVTFVNAYSSASLGAPTRASILTGKYPARLGLTDEIAARPGGGQRRPPRDKLVIPAASLYHLPSEETTIAEALHRSGYITCFTGNWGLGDEGFGPERYGFDSNFGGWSSGEPTSYFSPYRNPRLPDGPPGEHLDDRLAAESIRFLEHVGTSPFFLFHSFYSIHPPLEATKELIAKYEEKLKNLVRQNLPYRPGIDRAAQIHDFAVCAAMAEALDHAVGDIIDAIDRLELTENTIVIFMSDCGGADRVEGSILAKYLPRGGKGALYERGIRVPMVIDWPGVVKMGSRFEPPVISTDLYPTMLEMAGLPAMPTQHVDGLSLVPVLKEGGKAQARPAISPRTRRGLPPAALTVDGNDLRHRPLFWHSPHYGEASGPASSVMLDGWKLIDFFEGNRLELYNVSRDAPELHNFAVEQSPMAAKLMDLLKAWQKDVGAHLPTPK